MTNTLNHTDALNDLREVRAEISRLNKAAGKTVFNPAATDCLNEVMEWLAQEMVDA